MLPSSRQGPYFTLWQEFSSDRFTQHGHSEAELTPPYKNQFVRKWGPDGSIATGSEDWKLIADIAEAANGHTVVAKDTYDAFINTDLGNYYMRQACRGWWSVGL